MRPTEAFAVRDCALVVVSTGASASTLRELRDALLTVEAGSIYHHFWGRLLEPQFNEPEFNNDFASWIFRALHDKLLAERLSVIDPTDFKTIEDLRAELIDQLEMRLEEREPATWQHAADPLHLTTAQMVVFDTQQRAQTPAELATLVADMNEGSIFYHFVDARRRTPEGCDDFSSWLAAQGGQAAQVAAQLATVDPYFASLARTQQQLAGIMAGLALSARLGGEG